MCEKEEKVAGFCPLAASLGEPLEPFPSHGRRLTGIKRDSICTQSTYSTQRKHYMMLRRFLAIDWRGHYTVLLLGIIV